MMIDRNIVAAIVVARHLSAEGHKVIANGILQLLSKKKDNVFKAKHLGRFKKGGAIVTHG
jgi:hypothetical protein